MACDKRAGHASLYRVDGEVVTTVVARFTISNGPAFDEEAGRMYLADTALGIVDVFEFEPTSGTIGARARFVDVSDEGLRPDVMTVDDEGMLWVALGRSGSVRRYGRDSALRDVVEVPTSNPTSVAFGGEGGRPVHHDVLVGPRGERAGKPTTGRGHLSMSSGRHREALASLRVHGLTRLSNARGPHIAPASPMETSHAKKDLRRRSFAGSRLQAITLAGADLRGADFSDADLHDAELTESRCGMSGRFRPADSDAAEVAIVSDGCTLRDWRVAAAGRQVPVVLGFPDLDDYLHDAHSHGAIVGRVRNPTAGARFELGGRVYELSRSEGEHHLHGGVVGLGRRIWEREPDRPLADEREGGSPRMATSGARTP